MNRPFNINPVLKSMSYDNKRQILSIEFKRNGQIRAYECSPELAYGLFYCKSAAEEMAYYSNKIKKLCNVADVINVK